MDGLDIPRGDLYGSLNAWTEALAEYISYNVYLSSNYRIWSATNNIYFEAINPGSIPSNDLRLLASGSPVSATEVTYSEGEDEVRDTSVSMILKLFAFKEVRTDFLTNNFDFYELVKSWELEPLDDNTNTFFIEGGLRPYFSNDVVPDFDLSAITKNNNILLKYYLHYNEKSGDPPVETTTQSTDILYALNGGLKRKDYLDNTFLDDIITGTSAKFLTWYPTTKEITKQQQDFLHFISVDDGDTVIRLKVVATLIDGTTENKEVAISSNDLYDAYIIPVGYEYINSLNFSKEIVAYNVHIYLPDLMTNPVRSETRTFNIIDTPLLAKYFIFKNSLGVFESIMFNGEKTLSTEINKETSERILAFDDDETTNKKVVSHVTYTPSYKVYTGFKSQADLNHFIEFLKSEEVYEQMDDYWKPVYVNTKRVKLYGEQNFVESVAVEIMENSEKNYSNA
jgi:hypothetical protein